MWADPTALGLRCHMVQTWKCVFSVSKGCREGARQEPRFRSMAQGYSFHSSYYSMDNLEESQ
ncbi:hypothetical protein HanIR_Chr14g0677781 [Helianthus annuus]|nr:hypothetical protein HanIR_Chr14g0677781 [Helianthus annuus]